MKTDQDHTCIVCGGEEPCSHDFDAIAWPKPKMIIYIAGPMRGYPRFNFDAFDAAEKDLKAKGHCVVSPAQMDRDAGLDPDRLTEADVTPEFLCRCIKRDVNAILWADAIALLPGWEKSTGAKAELVIARWAQKQIFSYPEMTPL